MGIAQKIATSETYTDKENVVRSRPKEPTALSEDEKHLHARTVAAVNSILVSHGVTLHGTELQHVGAAIADFVVVEVEARLNPKEEESPRMRKK